MNYSKELKELYLMEQIYVTFFSVTNKLQISGDNYFEKITARQYMILLAIAHLPQDETTLVNISNKLGTSKQSANKLLMNLQNKGYIVTLPSKVDKRAINVVITEAGNRVLLECGEKEIEFLADIFKDFSCEELEVLWSLLKKLYGSNGEEKNVFEENISYKFDDMPEFQKSQINNLKKFYLQRKGADSNDRTSEKL